MFGSQALETAIGLGLMFFIVATAASMVVEFISRILKKRASDLDDAIRGMFGVPTSDGGADAMALFKETSVYRAAASGRPPSYLSAKSFADATAELLTTRNDVGETILRDLDTLPENLRNRLRSLVGEARRDLVNVKAGLERWFDDTMARTEGAYKRWSTTFLFVIGLALAAGLHVSTVDVAQDLWTDSITRQAVVDAADQTVTDQSQDPDLGIESVGEAAAQLDAAKLPVGWDAEAREAFRDWQSWGWWGTIVGFLLTALLVMLGAPFWFDLLGKLVSLRTTGAKPDAAAADPDSATRQQIKAVPVEAEPRTSPPKNDREIKEALAEMLAAKPS